MTHPVGPHDLVDIPGFGNFEVIGYAEDYTHGPRPFPRGVFPTPFEVGVHKYSSTTTNEYGREVPAYTPAVDQPGTPLKVHGWANAYNTEPKLAGHDRVTVDMELFVPLGLVVNLRRVEG